MGVKVFSHFRTDTNLICEALIMRLRKRFAVIFVFCILISAGVSFGAEKNTLRSPLAFVQAGRYEFAPVLEGTTITHDFIIQNKGTAPLKIEKVRSG